jgi:TonB family protein
MSGILALIVELNIAASAAILLVLFIRRPATRLFGPHAGYALWAIVPVATLAILLPERTTTTFVTDFLIGGRPASLAADEAAASQSLAPSLFFAFWIAGAIVLATLFIRRQHAFMRDAAIGLAGPAIVGFRHPRIVTPDDFSRRFSDDERKLILTHEQVHIDRSDARVNAVVAILRCLFWFNPLVHAGAKAMRIDQELSCDAEVVSRRPRVRRAYAETLLKTQLASRPLPVGCYWPAESQHPLAERIDLLARKPVSRRRRAAASVLVLILTTGAGITAWAAQPERTVFRETADIVVPFQPIPRDRQVAGDTTKPRLIPSSFQAPALPHHWRGKAEVVADLCLSSTGAVETAELAKSSGDAGLDAASLKMLRQARYEPATRNGKPVALCGQLVTLEFAEARTSAAPP